MTEQQRRRRNGAAVARDRDAAHGREYVGHHVRRCGRRRAAVDTRTGTIFRNLGRPTAVEVDADTGKRTYRYPMQIAGGGYLIIATADQDRGLAHIHVAYQPANEPPTRSLWRTDARNVTTRCLALSRRRGGSRTRAGTHVVCGTR